MIEPFLKLVAKDLYTRFGNNMSSIALIFPNKRAHLFFNEYLSECSETPIWAPPHFTINELIHMQSDLGICDPIMAVCELYRSYCKYVENPETLDFFYGWGERLLKDFDDIDRQLVETDKLFRNISAIKELEVENTLNEEQNAVLTHFFKSFSLERNSQLKQRFLDLWEQMLPIYDDFNTRLLQKGLTYEGALNRRVVEALQKDEIPRSIERFTHYAFIGFNVLTKSEEFLFSFFQEKKKALFYWDYDPFYLENKQMEAGLFLKQNLKRFPNAIPETAFNGFAQAKHLEFVASSTSRAQTHFAGQWLQTHRTEPENKTAIVLCDENLLQSMLHSIPQNVQDLNITNGFPLFQTTVYTRTEKFFTKEKCNGIADKQGELNLLAEFTGQLKEEAINLRTAYEGLERPTCDEQRAYQLQSEALFQVFTLFNRIIRYIQEDVLTINMQTLRRLLRQTMRQMIIPYHGEPITGIQIMGLLETRCLDFDHILFLSANEGTFPGKSSDNSFIPYFLRKAYGLTTNEHRVAITAYYFYRLLQRCSHCTLVYTDTPTGLSKGEMSRFMNQLLVETDIDIQRITLSSDIRPHTEGPSTIEKTADMLDGLKKLSPTALNTYLTCQLQFYFQQIAKLKAPKTVQNIIEADVFGSLFHKAAELAYTELTQNSPIVTVEALEKITENKGAQLIRFVREAFAQEEVPVQVVVEEVLRLYLYQLLENDKKLAPFEIVEMEQWHDATIPFQTAEGIREIKIGGFIDRMDLVNITNGAGEKITTLRIVDYKTGGTPESAKNMEELIKAEDNRPHYIFQTFIYALTLCGKTKWPIAPALFFVHKSASDDYNPYIRFGEKDNCREVLEFQQLAAPFKETLTQLLQEIFDTGIPFKATGSERMCRNCPYNTLCNRV